MTQLRCGLCQPRDREPTQVMCVSYTLMFRNMVVREKLEWLYDLDALNQFLESFCDNVSLR